MSPRKKLLVLFISVFLAVASVWLWWSKREPAFEGQRLSEWCVSWISAAEKSDTIGKEEAERAIRHIGTNAIPFAFRGVLAQAQGDSAPGKISELLMMVWPWYAKRISDESERKQQEEDAPVVIFSILGPQARPAIPRLKELTHKSQDLPLRYAAFISLAAIGNDTLSFLNEALSDPQDALCYPAAFLIGTDHPWGLFNIGTNGAGLVPNLVKLSTNKEILLVTNSIAALGKIGGDPIIVVPALTNACAAGDARIRAAAIASLALYGEKAGDALPTLRLALNDPEEKVREGASNALERIERRTP